MKELIDMQAGRLDETIKILRPQSTVNDYGERVQTYIDHYTTKAHIKYDNGNRDTENGEILHNYQKTMELWHYVDIKDTDWVEYDGKKYRVLSIDKQKKQLKQVVRLEKIND